MFNSMMNKLLSVQAILALVVTGMPGVGGGPAEHVALPQVGYSVSWPQCGQGYPPMPFAFGIVGVNRGHPHTVNPCLAEEYDWMKRATGRRPALYVNLDFGRSAVGPRHCSPADSLCQAYNYGFESADIARRDAAAAGAIADRWWLDVELGNHWSSSSGENAQVLRGAIAALHKSGVSAGIYSNANAWKTIMGDVHPALPIWLAGVRLEQVPNSKCTTRWAFSGGHVALVQFRQGRYDAAYAC